MNVLELFRIRDERPSLLAGEDLPPPPRQERSRAKREALLQAGLALFAERGYDATTIEDVAQNAGVAVGAFYQHFRSKRQLLLVVMDRLVEEVSRINLDFAAVGSQEPRALIEHVVRHSFSLDWDYAGAHRAWNEALSRDCELQKLNLAIEDWTARLAACFFGGVAHLPGSRSDLDVTALAWVVVMTFWKLAGRVSEEREDVVQALTHLVYHALFLDPPACPVVK